MLLRMDGYMTTFSCFLLFTIPVGLNLESTIQSSSCLAGTCIDQYKTCPFMYDLATPKGL